MEEVVITGTKTEINRNNVPLTVSVVSKEKIENSSESTLLPVLSEQVPGLFVTERGVTGFGVSTGSAGQISFRGPASTLYGTNAMGGVINIITKEQKEDGFKANVRAMYGSYNT